MGESRNVVVGLIPDGVVIRYGERIAAGEDRGGGARLLLDVLIVPEPLNLRVLALCSAMLLLLLLPPPPSLPRTATKDSHSSEAISSFIKGFDVK